MADETKEGLSTEELESQTGEALPDREAMSIVWIEPVEPVDQPLEGTKPIPIGEGAEPEGGFDNAIEPDKGPEPLGGGEQL
jgi:hypothetical protein